MRIFNLSQADWLIKEGCKVIGVGKGKIDRQAYILFDNDEHFKIKFKEYKSMIVNRG